MRKKIIVLTITILILVFGLILAFLSTSPVKVAQAYQIQFIKSGGPFPVWSATTNKITYTKKDGADDAIAKYYQVYTMNPDGSNEACLTCNKSQLANTKHRGQSYWHPSGNYIVFSAEDASLPRHWDMDTPYEFLTVNARPGIGRNFNVWVMRADGSQFWQITRYPKNWGVIETKFSHDGTKIYWSEEFSMEEWPNGKLGDPKWADDPVNLPYPNGHPGNYWSLDNWDYRQGEESGNWRNVYTSITFDANGPKVFNKNGSQLSLPFDPTTGLGKEIYKIRPPAGNTGLPSGPGFITGFETNGFTPDDQGFICDYSPLDEIVASGRPRREIWGEIYTSDLQGNNLKNLTNTPAWHNEDPSYSPNGRYIIYKESTIEPGWPAEGDELFLMNADGSNQTRITHFSVPGYSEYSSDWAQITETEWSPNGQQVVFGFGKEIPASEYGGVKWRIASDLYILSNFLSDTNPPAAPTGVAVS